MLEHWPVSMPSENSAILVFTNYYEGIAGIIVGGTTGIAGRKSPLVLWTVVSAAQWAILGGTYVGTLKQTTSFLEF